MKLPSILLALAMSGAATNAHAGIYDAADALFAAREGGEADVAAARTAYQEALSSATSSEDKAYGVQQLGRLAVYEGVYLLPDLDANKVRKAGIFDACRRTTLLIASEVVVRSVFTYWQMACTAQWMKYATVADRLAQLGDIRRNFDEVVDDDLEIRADAGIDGRYYGGGIYRVLAGIYSNVLASLMRDGLPRGDKAQMMIDRALAARAYPGDDNAGADYYMNYRHKVEVLQFNGQAQEAERVRTTAIDELEELLAGDGLPSGLEPESRGELRLLRAAQ